MNLHEASWVWLCSSAAARSGQTCCCGWLCETEELFSSAEKTTTTTTTTATTTDLWVAKVQKCHTVPVTLREFSEERSSYRSCEGSSCVSIGTKIIPG